MSWAIVLNSGISVRAEIFQILFSPVVNNKTDIAITNNKTETEMGITDVEYLTTKLFWFKGGTIISDTNRPCKNMDFRPE